MALAKRDPVEWSERTDLSWNVRIRGAVPHLGGLWVCRLVHTTDPRMALSISE